MSVLFDYPKKAEFSRVLPKSKIYEKAKPTTAVKNLFVQQIDQITWKYKLAPETINIPATKAVPEIEIFQITLKNGDLKEDVLRCIDRAVALPIIYELYYGEKCQVVASYKRPNEADSSKWVLSSYFKTEWLPINEMRQPLPVSLNLGNLYQVLLKPLLPITISEGDTLKALVEKAEKIRSYELELAKAKSRLNKTKQFNRKVEINAEIRIIKQQLEKLTGGEAAAAK
mgnify:CR=1 FL=1|tara:strand:- start:64 stop:747 length:684 start_codon:yes stop_codon:yes gene_type:complete